jgi:hypothetical protein
VTRISNTTDVSGRKDSTGRPAVGVGIVSRCLYSYGD